MAFSIERIEPDEASFLEYFETMEAWPAKSLERNIAHRKTLLKNLCKKLGHNVLNYFIISSTWRDFFAKNERMHTTELMIQDSHSLPLMFSMCQKISDIPICDSEFLNAYYLLNMIPETYRNIPGLCETVLSMLDRPLHNEATHAYLNQLILSPHKKVMHKALFDELRAIPSLDLALITEETPPTPEIIATIQNWQKGVQIQLETLRHHLMPLLSTLPRDASSAGPQLLQLFANLRNALLQGEDSASCNQLIQAASPTITEAHSENPAAARPLVDSDDSEGEEAPLRETRTLSDAALQPIHTTPGNHYFQNYLPLECLNRYQQMDRYKIGDQLAYDPLFFRILESLNLETNRLKTWIQNTLIHLLPSLPDLWTMPAEESDDVTLITRPSMVSSPSDADDSMTEPDQLDDFFCFHVAKLLQSLSDHEWPTQDPAIAFLKQQAMRSDADFASIFVEMLIQKYFSSEASSTTRNLLTALILKKEINETMPLDQLIYQAFIKNFPNTPHYAQNILAVFKQPIPVLTIQKDLLSLDSQDSFEGTGLIFCPLSSFYDLIVDLFALVETESAQSWLESLFKKAASGEFIPKAGAFETNLFQIFTIHHIPSDQHSKMINSLFIRFLTGLAQDDLAMKEIQKRTKEKIVSYGEKTVLINYTPERLTELFLAFKMAYDNTGHTKRNRFAKGMTAALLLLCTGLFSVCAYGIITQKKIGLESLLPKDMPHAGNMAPLLGSLSLSVATSLIYAISHQCYFNTESLAQLSGSLHNLDVSSTPRCSQKTKLGAGLLGTLSLSGILGWVLYLGITDQLYFDLGGGLTAQDTPNNKAAQGTTTAIMILAQLFVVLLPTLLYKMYGAFKIEMPPEHTMDRMEEGEPLLLSEMPDEVSEDRGSYKGPADALNGLLVGYTAPSLPTTARTSRLPAAQCDFIPIPLSMGNPFRAVLQSQPPAIGGYASIQLAPSRSGVASAPSFGSGAGTGTGTGLRTNSAHAASGGTNPFGNSY